MAEGQLFDILGNTANALVNVFGQYNREHPSDNSVYLESAKWDAKKLFDDQLAASGLNDGAQRVAFIDQLKAKMPEAMKNNPRLSDPLDQQRVINSLSGYVDAQRGDALGLATKQNQLRGIGEIQNNAVQTGEAYLAMGKDPAQGIRDSITQHLDANGIFEYPAPVIPGETQELGAKPKAQKIQLTKEMVDAQVETGVQTVYGKQIEALIKSNPKAAELAIPTSHLNEANKKNYLEAAKGAQVQMQYDNSVKTTGWLADANGKVYDAFSGAMKTRDTNGKITDQGALQTIAGYVAQADTQVQAGIDLFSKGMLSKDDLTAMKDHQEEWNKLYSSVRDSQLEKKMPEALKGELALMIGRVRMTFQTGQITDSQQRSAAIIDLQNQLQKDPRFRSYIGSALTDTNSELQGLVNFKTDSQTSFVYKLADSFATQNIKDNPALAGKADKMAQELVMELQQKASAGGKVAGAITFDNNTIQNAWNNKISQEIGAWGNQFDVLRDQNIIDIAGSDKKDRSSGFGGDATKMTKDEQILSLFDEGKAYGYGRLPLTQKQWIDRQAMSAAAYVGKAAVPSDGFFKDAKMGYLDLESTNGQLIITAKKGGETKFYKWYPDQKAGRNLWNLFEVNVGGPVGQRIEVLSDKKDWRTQ